MEDYLFIGKGIALGVEIAQREAVIIPNILDHFIQNKTNIIRYMDDSVFFVKTYNEGKHLFNEYIKLCNSLKIKINIKKSFIVSIKSCFKYCKWKYKILNNGKIICKPCIKTIKRQRLKLKKMEKIKISINDINNTINSLNAYLLLGAKNNKQILKFLKAHE